MTSSAARLELEDVQGLVARGYRDLHAATYVLLGVADPAKARAWLAQLRVTPASERPSERATHLALSASGLRRVGLDEAVWRQFPREFRGGMTTSHRRRVLGDSGPNAPESWRWGGPATPDVDLLLALFARDEAALGQHYTAIQGTFADGGVAELDRLDATPDLDGREHFGFADGISQPTVAGLSSRIDLPSNTIQPGEVILGYPNEYGQLTDGALVGPTAAPAHAAGVGTTAARAHADGVGTTAGPAGADGVGSTASIGRNGTYLVFRQLEQDVRGFWRWVDQAVDGDPSQRLWLASKMVGRWPSGAPMTLSPDADNPSLAAANDFAYHHADQHGSNCPIGAHVRRAHPRDSLDPNPGTESSWAVNRRHRLLRRGREYGPPVAPADVLSPAPPDDPERGLYFICLVANIARQFELVQHTWMNSPKFGALYADPDPIVSNHTDMDAHFTVPADPIRKRYTNLPHFVTTRGGGYFFLPGLRALKLLAARE